MKKWQSIHWYGCSQTTQANFLYLNIIIDILAIRRYEKKVLFNIKKGLRFVRRIRGHKITGYSVPFKTIKKLLSTYIVSKQNLYTTEYF